MSVKPDLARVKTEISGDKRVRKLSLSTTGEGLSVGGGYE